MPSRHFRFRTPIWHRSSHEPVLGTRLDLRVRTASERTARSIADDCLAEIERLENVFSVFRPNSDFNRWRASSEQTLSQNEHPELSTVLALAERWTHATGGLFNPTAGVLIDRWKRAEIEQRRPDDDELHTLSTRTRELPYTVEPNGDIHKRGDCTTISVHAIAKGWIADRAAEFVASDRRGHGVVVNIGGDVRHIGDSFVSIAIENPLRAYDNEPALARTKLWCGLATSGGSRRGFTIRGEHYSHVIDPRTGQSVDHVASASVFADDAASADVIATALCVLSPTERTTILRTIQPLLPDAAKTVGFLLVEPSGAIVTNPAWDQQSIGH
jgi:FAD:protein FMN transferase